MVTTFYPPYHFGGDATYIRALSRALVARGHSVDAFQIKQAHAVPQANAEDDGIVVHRLHSSWGPLSPLVTQQTGRPGIKAPALRAILDRDFDVVNFHNLSLIGGPGLLFMSRASVNLYTLHEHWLLCPTHVFWKYRKKPCDRPQCIRCCVRSGIPPQLWRYTSLLRRATAMVDLFLSPSAYTAQRHRQADLGAPIRVLPLFSVLEPEPQPAFTRPPRPHFVYVGRLTISKGLIPLLDYFQNTPDYDLSVVGHGELRTQLTRDYQASPHIRFLGSVPQQELIRIYASATAVILPSLAPETFGLTVVEAFACGTPAIVRNAGGNREPVDATGGGFVYRTEAELGQAVDALAKQPELRTDFARRAYDGYKKHFTKEHHLEGYLNCITTIQQEKRLKGI